MFENVYGYKHCKATLKYVICEFESVSYVVVFSFGIKTHTSSKLYMTANFRKL